MNWTSVKDKLPSPWRQVLCCVSHFPDDTPYVDCVDEDGCWESMLEPTHWVEFPPLPKE